MNKNLPEFKVIVTDNEHAVRRALDRGNLVQAFLLIHALIESLLRHFLHCTGRNPTFDGLIKRYEEYLESESYPFSTFVKELTEFNRRRSRIVHNLWQRGYTFTNKSSEPAAGAAIIIYGLLIEWLETFDPEIPEYGFQNE